VLSAAFGTAAQRGRIAITDIRASDQPGAEPLHTEEGLAEEAAAEAGLAVAEATLAVVAATAVVGTDRSEGKSWQA
jgi:Pyruvate/2-oxoacid:ferredoxin oxidoreductase gamma subunit